ncbi:hypothetical protein QVD17_33028 [Tagetes erecta]|uniref:Uncharacterized protein n=1 Tax=Tagetes erecta TaxID=13708 RepID=A0AAD8NL32_TARER|nr:hypothetical protein QVD17_33028 [Tagetes erecta]
MSFSGIRRRSAIYSIMLLLMFFSLLQIWVLNPDCCRIRAIRTSLSSSSFSKDSKRRELHRKFFNGGLKDESGLKSKSFQQSNRQIPSCPDALHN